MSKAGFGEHLKREREMRGVSLDEICAATRISTRFLQALEKEHWEVLPGGIFNRGFVRAVARFLGLDEDSMVAEYVLAVNQQSATAPAWADPQAPPQVTATKSRMTLGISSVLAVLLVLGGGSFAWRWYAGSRAQDLKAQNAITAVEEQQPKPHTSDGSASTSPDHSSPETVLAERPPAATDAPQGVAGLQLKIEAGKATTLTVWADGSRVFRGRIAAGESRTFDAQNVFEVSARNTGALLLELNGQTLAQLAPSAHPGRIKVSRDDLKPQQGGAD